MFSGIVEATGTVATVVPHAEGKRLTVRLPPEVSGFQPGDSVAVNGVCLTVEDCEDAQATFFCAPETLQRSNLKAVAAGSRLNLERPLTLARPLDGHLVQGHVDGEGRVARWAPGEDQSELAVEVPAALTRYVVEKGSIALNGVSLTVVDIRNTTLSVMVIPYTLDHTNLGDLREGRTVNVEVDMIAKYVESLLRGGYLPAAGTESAAHAS